jgi:DNA repair protein RecO (recombination protein O)
MPSGDAQHSEAILVRSASFGESNRMLTLITSRLGKTKAVARGARRSKRRFPPSVLQPLQVLGVVLEPGRRGDVMTLVEAEIVRCFPSIPRDPRRYAAATCITEVVRELTPWGEVDPGPLSLLSEAYARIETDGFSVALFASLLLDSLKQAGVAPVLDRCAACGRPAPAGAAGRFDTSRGVVCSSCAPGAPVLRGKARQALLELAYGRPVGPECPDHELAVGVERLLELTTYQAEREIRSAALVARYLRTAR